MRLKKRVMVLITVSFLLFLCIYAKNGTDKTVPDMSVSKENSQTKVDNTIHESTKTENKSKLTAFEKNFADAPFWAQDENGLYGFIDQTGDYVIDPQFYDIGDKYHTFSFGVAFVQDNETTPKLWGLIDTLGNYIVEPSFSNAGIFTGGLAYVQDMNSGLYGYIDPTGTYQIEPQFTEARPFVNDLAIVSRGYGYEYIDTSGKTVIAGEFEDANNFSDDLAAVKSRGLWGYIDRSGEFVVQPTYDMVYSFSDGVAFVHENADGYALIDTDGNYITYDSIYTPADYTPNDGRSSAKWVGDLCCVQVAMDDSYPELGFGYAYINKNGEKVLPKDDTYYNKAWSFVESDDGIYAAVADHDSGLYGYIDINGSWVISPQYKNGSSLDISPFGGIGLVEESRAYIDMSGTVLAKVDAPISFVGRNRNKEILLAESLAEDHTFGKYGYVYPDGSVAIDFIYDTSTGFAVDGSYAFVQHDGLWGAIDIDGNWLIPARFRDIQGVYISY